MNQWPLTWASEESRLGWREVHVETGMLESEMPRGVGKEGRAGDGLFFHATSRLVLGRRRRLAEGLDRYPTPP